MRVVLDYFWDMSRWMLLALPCWVLGRSLFLAAGRKKTRWGREIVLTLFVLTLAGVLSQTVLPPPGQPILTLTQARARWELGTAINLRPLFTIRAFWQRGTLEGQLVNLLGNVAVFVPLGLLMPWAFPALRRWWAVTLLCGGLSLAIEFTQLFLARSVDVDDLLLNTLGGLLGYLLFVLGRALFSRENH